MTFERWFRNLKRSSSLEDRREEAITTVLVGKGPDKALSSNQIGVNIGPDYLEWSCQKKAPYHPFVFFRFYRASGIKQPAAACQRPGSSTEESELLLGESRNVRGSQAPFYLGVRAQRSCACARSINENPVESCCRSGER